MIKVLGSVLSCCYLLVLMLHVVVYLLLRSVTYVHTYHNTFAADHRLHCHMPYTLQKMSPKINKYMTYIKSAAHIYVDDNCKLGWSQVACTDSNPMY